MNTEPIITKYTGHHLDRTALLTVADGDDEPLATELARAVEQAAYEVAGAETELAHLATTITNAATTVTATLQATAGQRTRSVNPLGELQASGPRFDAVIAVRSERIAHLRTLVHLWQQTRPAPKPPTC